MRRVLLVLALLVVLFAACQTLVPERFAVNVPIRSLLGGTSAPSEAEFDSRVRVPAGFHIGIWASDVRGARFLRFTPAGDLLVSVLGSGRIELLRRDSDGDGLSDGKRVLMEDLDRPHGLDLRDGWLYVGETGAVGRIRFEASDGTTQGEYEHIITGLPTGGNHWTRTVRFGPDGLLYVSIGSSCNACDEDDPRRAAIVRYQPDGAGEEIFATGLRNAVGFDWRPETGALYANDNGRDLLGDDFPPCELNLVELGGFYGWPFVHGDGVPDPDFGAKNPERRDAAIPPVHGYAAHTAPLGLHFVHTGSVPPDFRGAALSALHGSWNRTQKVGYKVVSIHWLPDGTIEERDFITGFEIDDDVIGRPVDVVEGPDGAFYVSDDFSGSIYRVTYTGADVASRPGRP